MTKQRFVLGFIIIALLIGAWTPYPADTQASSAITNESRSYKGMLLAAKTPQLTINNQTGASFYLTLTGPQTYYFNIPVGKTKLEVEKGDYDLTYFACNANQTETVNVKKKGATLKITCASSKDKDDDKSAKIPQLTINNQTGASFYLTLTGPQTYYFNAPDGKTKFEVEQGEYDLTYFACGANQAETVNVKKKGATLKITCASSKDKDDDKSAKIPQLTINNQTGASFYLTVTGPKTYYFNVPAGKTKFDVDIGEYDLTYFACGANQAETVNVKKKGATLKITCASSKDKDVKDDSKSGKTPQLTIQNQTGASFYLTVTGPKTYYFNVPTGKTKFDVDIGEYDLTYFACGANQTKTVNVKKKGATLKINCKEQKKNTVKVTVNNKTDGVLTIILDGPEYYTFYLPVGKTKIEIAKGTYNYTVYGCGSSSATGTENWKRGGTWYWQCGP